MTVGEAFTKRFITLLNERNISLYKFSKDSCIPRSTLNNILLGNTKSPTLALVYQVVDGFNMSYLEFLDDPIFANINIEYI